MATFGPVIQTPEPEEDEEGVGALVVVEVGDEDIEAEDIEGFDDAGGHYDNIADMLDEDRQEQIARDVIDSFNNDRQSRSDWAKSYVKGLDLLGIKVVDRTQPWPGAAGVFHPILMESVVRFQAQAMGELFPAQGPARTKIVGKSSTELLAQAQRVEREMNYQMTENMEEFREEMEQLLFHLPLAGSCFKKIFFDPTLSRPCAMMVPSEDLVVSYGATSLTAAERFTHVMRMSKEEIEDYIDAGFYSDVDVGAATGEQTDIQEKYDELMGAEKSFADDNRHMVLEQHVMMKLEDEDGRSLPYIVTVDKDSGKLLSVRRGWREGDVTSRRIMYFAHYKYLPGLGFYGLGLIHLLGGLTKTATSILRQLIDAGTLANLPAGFKTRGLRVKGDNTPFMPGEFRDVDVMSGSIDDNLKLIPYKEPSTVLYQLLGNVTEEARRVGSVAESELTNLSREMPVGTAFALLERQMKVMTGVQARLHAALGRELKILARIIAENMGSRYDWDTEEEYDRSRDFDSRVDVIPVSDPNASTTAQRVVAYQAAMEMSAQAPSLYNMGRLHRQMLDVLQIDNADEILKLPEDIKPADPVTENMALLKQEPVKAFLYQDHEAHIAVHMAAAQDPKIQQLVGQSPFASAIQNALAAHITEHVAMAYRKEIERTAGVPLPPMEETLPEDVEVELSRVAQEAADKLLQRNRDEVAAQQAEQAKNDPVTILQERELAIKEKEVDNDFIINKMKLEIDAVQKGANIAHMRERLNSEEMRAAGNLAVKLMTEPRAEDKVAVDAAKVGVEQMKALQEEGRDDNAGE